MSTNTVNHRINFLNVRITFLISAVNTPLPTF